MTPRLHRVGYSNDTGMEIRSEAHLFNLEAALMEVDQHADGTETIVDDYRVRHNSSSNLTEWEFTLGSGTFTTSSGVSGGWNMSGGGSTGNSRTDTVIYDNGVTTRARFSQALCRMRVRALAEMPDTTSVSRIGVGIQL